MVLAPPGVETARVTVASFAGFWSSRVVSTKVSALFSNVPLGDLQVRAEASGLEPVEKTVTWKDRVTLELPEKRGGEERFPSIGESVADVSALATPPKASRKARRIDPESTTAWANLAAILLEGGNADAAIHEYRRILEREPGNLRALIGLGRAYIAIDQFILAAGPLYQATRTDSTNAGAHLLLAKCYLKLGLREEALAPLRRYLELEPLGKWAARVQTIIEDIERSSKPD